MSAAGDRNSLHRLIDELRSEDLRTAERVLQAQSASSDLLLTTGRNRWVKVDDRTVIAWARLMVLERLNEKE
jgi:hypothetical protein